MTTDDWDAVAAAIDARMKELGTTQQQVAVNAGISQTTLRELQHNLNPRRRRQQTLASVSSALNWPSTHLRAVLMGADPSDAPEASTADRVAKIESQVASLNERMEVVERAQQAD